MEFIKYIDLKYEKKRQCLGLYCIRGNGSVFILRRRKVKAGIKITVKRQRKSVAKRVKIY